MVVNEEHELHRAEGEGMAAPPEKHEMPDAPGADKLPIPPLETPTRLKEELSCEECRTGHKPCSVEHFVAAGYPAEKFEDFCRRADERRAEMLAREMAEHMPPPTDDVEEAPAVMESFAPPSTKAPAAGTFKHWTYGTWDPIANGPRS